MKARFLHAKPLKLTRNVGGKSSTDLLPTYGELCCTGFELLMQGGNLLVELLHIHIVVVDAFQFSPNAGKSLQYGRNRPAVLLFEPVEHVHARLHLIEA